MDNLDRQPGEKFHTWAHRIHNRYTKCTYWGVPYPASINSVNQYIERIRNSRKCYDCGRCFAKNPFS